MTHPGVTGRFLSPAICEAIVGELERESCWQWGEVNYGGGSEIDLDFRRAQWCEMPPSCESVIAERLLAVARGLEREFGTLGSFEGPNLLRYRSGDFFRPHPDENPRTRIRPRKVTITVPLNDRGFTGGCLRLHAPGGRTTTIPPAAGRFVAFESRMVHEVTQIVGGNRYALVAWLH